jgi:hypothetical protein
MMTKRHLFLLLSIICMTAQAQSVTDGLHYDAEIQTTFGNGDYCPLWLNANKYGLSSIKSENGYILAGVTRDAATDSLRKWKRGYGVEIAGAYNQSSSFIVQQAYMEFIHKKFNITIGAKEHPMEMKNQELSSGGMTFGINARPIPEVRVSIPEYIDLRFTKDWIAVKGLLSYGMFTDSRWQKHWVGENLRYTDGQLYHSKAIYFRNGNEKKFPLIVEFGLETATLFGGTAYNVKNNNEYLTLKTNNLLKSAWHALFPGGKDATDAQHPNKEGDWVGSLMLSASWNFKSWKIRAYMDHFFEDNSALFFTGNSGFKTGDEWKERKSVLDVTGYKLKDGLFGMEITLPHNPIAQSFVYEYIYTKYQSGPVYHEHTPEVADNVFGVDNYYNHSVTTGWQHWGQALGNPLFTAPLYNSNHELAFANNRFIAHHFGLNGNPIPQLHYRALLTYQESWGTYAKPYDDIKYNTSALVEVTYTPRVFLQFRGLSFTAALGMDHGSQYGNNTAMQITIRKIGLLR